MNNRKKKTVKFSKPIDLGNRSWGREILLTLIPKKISLKKLIIKKGKAGGLQYHHKKNECGYIESGKLLVRFDNLNREFTQYKETNNSEVWIERCLKLDFIFKKMKQIGALPEDHGAWVWDMVEDIEFPNGTGHTSIYLNLPRYVRNKYLPSESDADIQFQEREDAIIEDLSREAELFNQNFSEHFRNNLDENPEVVMNHIRTIQTRFREYIRPNREEKIKAAIKIQSLWRGFCGRGIVTYKGELFELVNECKISLEQERIFSPVRDSLPMRILFVNTSKEIIHYQWIKVNNTDLEGRMGSMFNILPGRNIVVKAYYGHWFRICKEGDCDRFFRIETSSFLGRLRTSRTTNCPAVFDLNTGVTLTHSDFKEWQWVGGSRAVRTLDTSRLSIQRNLPPQNNHNNSDDEDGADDARMMLAIQLSLEQNCP